MNENSTIIKEILSLRYCPSLKIGNKKFVSNDFVVQEKSNYLEYIENSISKKIQNEINEKRISVALSGGVDSTLVIALLRKTKFIGIICGKPFSSMLEILPTCS